MKTPVAIVGGGPGGSSLALFLARQGIKSTIVERDAFPRYHIGESMTGECGGVVRALGLEHKMLEHRYP
jgi:1H-pyrrole-2-carbonyl-[peptidyl-carrier protein] brominase